MRLTVLFLNLCSLTDSAFEVVELASANTTVSYEFNLGNVGGMEKGYPLNTNTVDQTAKCEGFRNT